MNDDSKKWVMPEWMEEYLPLMIYPKFQIEDLMNDKSDVFTNTVRALMAVGVKGMVDLLLRMRLSGKLRLNWKYGYDGVTHKEHGDFYVGHLPDKEGDLKYRVIPDWMAKDMDEEGMWWLPLEEVDEERVLCGGCGSVMEEKRMMDAASHEPTELDWMECPHCGAVKED